MTDIEWNKIESNQNSFAEFCRLTNLAIEQRYLCPSNQKKLRKFAKKHILDIMSLDRQMNITIKEHEEMVLNYYSNLIKPNVEKINQFLNQGY